MTNPEIPASKLERIRNLLAKAEGTDNEHEQETFLSAATALMAKYGIEQAHLEESDPGRRTRPIRRDITIPQGSWGRQRADLAWAIAEAMRCRALIFTGATYRLAVVGYQSDVERAEMMFTSIMLQMTGSLVRLKTPKGLNTLRYRKAWIIGYRQRVAQRIKAMEQDAQQEAEQTTTGTELMLLDRSARVEAMYTDEFSSLSIRKGRKQKVSREGFQAGMAAGDRANLGGNGLENRKRALSR